MLTKKIIHYGAVLIALFTLNVLAEPADNPYRKSLDITKKYLPEAIAAMWQSEYLVWRAQLFNSACSQNQQAVKNTINSSFPLFNQYIIDQAIINKTLTDDSEKLILQNSNKLYYLIFSEVYAFAYKKRLQIIKQYHPEITLDLCTHAKKSSQQYPAYEQAIMPWQTTNQLEVNTWRAELFSMRTVNKYFINAFMTRQKPFANIIDAEIYARIQQDEKAIIAFTDISESYRYGALLMKEIAKAYTKTKGRELPDKLWRPIYAQEASLLASRAYKLATVSALMQLKALYPELSPRIEAHMLSYVKLQLSTLDQDKKRLSKAFNAG
ncbi:hypothetical protein H4J38_03200 [Colwellia sp. BRX10-3]|uniref:hypothetical protein n=1 Tax=Colwellia sp. BRX10-3 TaxID=2759844 RepID=UPI0015F5E5D3|nr:hypothetical protein [Colwellia sp. BRX10-3]MBA6389782.1 hypothetical protein [Colwellia sp. BRX10-3]